LFVITLLGKPPELRQDRRGLCIWERVRGEHGRLCIWERVSEEVSERPIEPRRSGTGLPGGGIWGRARGWRGEVLERPEVRLAYPDRGRRLDLRLLRPLLRGPGTAPTPPKPKSTRPWLVPRGAGTLARRAVALEFRGLGGLGGAAKDPCGLLLPTEQASASVTGGT